MIYERQTEYEDALSAFRRAVELDSTYADAHCQLGQILLLQGLPEQADASFGTALRQRPGHARAAIGRARVSIRQGKHAEGEALLRGVLDADPFEAEARHRLGNLYLRQGRTEEGKEILDAFERLRVVSHEVNRFRRILNTHPRDADAHYNLGVLYAGQGLYREAAAAYRRALAVNPGDTSARKNLTNLLRKHPSSSRTAKQQPVRKRSDPDHEKVLQKNRADPTESDDRPAVRRRGVVYTGRLLDEVRPPPLRRADTPVILAGKRVVYRGG